MCHIHCTTANIFNAAGFGGKHAGSLYTKIQVEGAVLPEQTQSQEFAMMAKGVKTFLLYERQDQFVRSSNRKLNYRCGVR